MAERIDRPAPAQDDREASYAEIGRALEQAIVLFVPGWSPAECPSEIVSHLCNELDEARPAQTEQQPVAWLPYLSDGADGVTGHYAIARKNPAGYREVWNLRRHHWAAFSDEVLTLDEALAILKKLEMPTAPSAQTEQQPDGEAVEIVASAIDGPCREVESIDDMAQIICGQLAEAGFLRVRKSEAANFAAPIADVLCRFGLSRDDAEALGAELAIALIPHLAQWDEDHHAAPIAQIVKPEQSGLAERLSRVVAELKGGFVVCQQCGDQEDTATLDCVPELEAIAAALSAQGGK